LVGVPLGLFAAQLIAWTESFLRWSPQPGVSIQLLEASWWHGLLVLLLAVPAILLPALRASKRTIISYKQERARATHVPVWQRLGLDLLLLVPAIYGYQQLRLHGVIGVPGVAQAAARAAGLCAGPVCVAAAATNPAPAGSIVYAHQWCVVAAGAALPGTHDPVI
jgi:putative ABC transport system permease protein